MSAQKVREQQRHFTPDSSLEYWCTGGAGGLTKFRRKSVGEESID